MPLNTAQYVAPLNSAGVLAGYSQGVKQGTGVTIAPDGTISLNPTGAATLGFLTSSSTPAPIYNWSTVAGAAGSILTNDGAGNVYWATDYVQVYPIGSSFPHTGAAAIPAGTTAARPGSPEGSLRYNTDFDRLEFFNGSAWLPVSPASGGVFSFVGPATPTANFAGDIWLDTNTNQAKIWDGVSWTPTSPLATALVPGRVKIGTNVQIAGDGTISILPTTGVPGLVSNVGVTTVTDNTSSFSIDSALSANQGRLLQDQINAILISNNLTFAGLIAGNGLMTFVTPEGALQGFVSGSPLPGPSVTNEEYFVIVESAGGFTPPGGAFTTVTQGDWFLSTGIVWQFLNVGYDPPYATETVPGVIEIATQAESNAGVDDTRALTPAKLFGVVASGAIDANDILLSPTINGNTTVQNALLDAVYNITSTGLTVTVTSAPTGLFNLEVTQATETQLGGAQIATDVETQALALDTVIVTPLKLGNLFSSGAIDANDVLLNPLINGNTSVQAALNDTIYDISSSNTSVTVVETAVGQVDVTVTQATESQLGGAEIATQVQTDAGTDDTVVVTPLKLAGRTATETRSGIAEIATQAEANAGTDDTRILTPLKLFGVLSSGAIDANDILLNPTINGQTNVQDALADAIYDITSTDGSVTVVETAVGQVDVTVTQATETQLGGGEIATQAETNAGLLDTVLLTPQKLAGYFASGQLEASDIVVNPAINGNNNVQAALADAVYNIASAANTIVVSSSATGLFNVEVRQATETQLGGAEIATQTETETGIDDARIVTPLKLRTAAIYKSDFNAKGDILSAQGNDQPLILPVGTNTQYLVADSTTPTGLKWFTLPSTVGVAGLVSNVGITTITDNVTSTSIDSALSANQGKLLQDQIDALVITNNLTFAGTLNSAGVLTFVTSEGLAAGFTVGSTLPVAAAGNAEYFVICEQAGTITPPGGVATVVTQGDWFVSTGASWQLLNVGFDAPYASTTQPGLVELATDAETQTGTDTLRAVTPSNLTSRTATETRTGIAEIATQAETDAGTDDTRIVTPLKLRTAAVYKSDFNAKGDLLSATANDSPSILSVGTAGQILTVDLTTPTGLKWTTPSTTNFAIYNLDDISGSFNGATLTFNLTIGGVAYSPNPTSNIMVFIGGIAQTPGAGGAYTITGSTITFTSAPPSGASFYATTVK